MVHGCTVYTELAPRRQQFHVAPAMPAVDIQKMRYKKLVTHVESHARAVSLLKRAENSAIEAINNQPTNVRRPEFLVWDNEVLIIKNIKIQKMKSCRN